MRFRYEPLRGPGARSGQDAIFNRMQAEGLLGCAMSALPAPTHEDWRRITNPRWGLLLRCYAQPATEKTPSQKKCGPLTDEDTFMSFWDKVLP